MKKFFKIVFYTLLVLIVITGASYLTWHFFLKSKSNLDAFATIPEDAVFIVETTDLSKAWKQISESDLWQYLMKTEYFSDLNKDIESIDKYIKSNQKIADMILNNRKLIVSAHMTSGVNSSFLFSVDLKDMAATIGSMENALKLIDGFKVEKTEFKAENDNKKFDIVKLTSEKNPKEVFFISFVDNILLVSFDGVLIEKAISQRNDEHWNKDNKFQEIMVELAQRKLFKIYFNYSYFNKYSKTFLTSEDEIIKMLSESLAYSIFDIDIKGTKFSLEGFTNLDSVNSYVRALVNVEPGKLRAYDIMTNQSAAYFSISFKDYMTFYNNLMDEYRKSNPAEVEEIEKSIGLVEDLLGVDLHRDFFSWIGEEVALFKVRPISEESRMEDIVIAIHANDIDNAREGLTNITKKIRRRSPLRFDIIEYRNFEINYLEQKNFFKMFFGELFNKMEKPFFTYIEDFVVFSNSLDLLQQVIDDYINGKTLSHTVEFQDFIDNFSPKSNIAVFIQMPKMFNTLYNFTPEDKKQDFIKNKEMILSFARVGFQLVSDGQKFETSLLAEYDENALTDDAVQKLENSTSNNMFNANLDSMGFKIELPVSVLENYSQYKTYWDEDSTNIKHEGKIENNLLNGIWRSYYESGNIQCAINYKNGKVVGIGYFYYDDEVNTKLAEVNFEEDKIVGVYQEFWDNGAQKALIAYNNGVMDGDAQFFYRSGRLKMEGKYKDGLKHGKWKYYSETGDLLRKERWRNGENKGEEE